MASTIAKILNYMFPTSYTKATESNKRDLRNYISPVKLERIRQDIQSWRTAISEAEDAWYPHRVRMQRMYNDTILNGHVKACMRRRKNLTLLKEFHLVNSNDVEDEKSTMLLNKRWFHLYCNYVLDSLAFGYTLIQLGDIVNGEFPKITPIRRFNVSPDRLNVASYIYSISGANFMDKEYAPWFVWVPTPTEIGVSLCGYGYLYEVAMYEIVARNTLGFNADAAELYGMPLRVGSTSKTNEDERAEFEQSLAQMGSAGYIVKDLMDEIELIESKGSGQGFKIYESLEQRCEKKISKIILGHADALDSVPGKLGSSQGDENPVAVALSEAEANDCRFLEHNINTELLPRLREFGFPISEDIRFEYKNDRERLEIREREDKNNKLTAEIAQTMKNAGLKMDPMYFEERTGIPTEAMETPAPQLPGINPKVKNRLDELYI